MYRNWVCYKTPFGVISACNVTIATWRVQLLLKKPRAQGITAPSITCIWYWLSIMKLHSLLSSNLSVTVFIPNEGLPTSSQHHKGYLMLDESDNLCIFWLSMMIIIYKYIQYFYILGLQWSDSYSHGSRFHQREFAMQWILSHEWSFPWCETHDLKFQKIQHQQTLKSKISPQMYYLELYRHDRICHCILV